MGPPNIFDKFAPTCMSRDACYRKCLVGYRHVGLA